MNGAKWQGVLIGRPAEENEAIFKVPLVAGLAPEAQYQRPNSAALRLMKSYVRYAARMKHPDNLNWPVDRIFVYSGLRTPFPPGRTS